MRSCSAGDPDQDRSLLVHTEGHRHGGHAVFARQIGALPDIDAVYWWPAARKSATRSRQSVHSGWVNATT